MKHKNAILIKTVLFLSISFISIGVLQAQETTDNNTPTINTIPNIASQNPATQDEANKIIDVYIRQAFKDLYYTEKSSVGEVKMVIKNKYLLTKQQIDFASINYNIDKSFKFEGAQYTWKITKGDKVIIEVSNVDKSAFFYNFADAGTYQIEVAINSAGVIKTGSITVDVMDKISLDYRPLNPGKGDTISIATEIPVSQYTIEWKVDGKVVETNNNTISFVENKGYDQKYVVEAIARDRGTGYTKYYGVSEIEIKTPEIRVSLINSKNNTPIDFADELAINEELPLLISSDLSNISKNSKVSYTYRVNDQIQDGNGNSVTLDVNPNQSYRIDIIAKDNTNDEINILKTFYINKDKAPTLEANISATNRFIDTFKNDRYVGLAVLAIAGVIIAVMSSHSKLVKSEL